jgi:thiol:disulfide interchange protein
MAVGLALPLLALPWSLPPLARSLGPAVAAGPLPGLAAFAMLGLALALPYLVLAAWPGLVRRLPAPWAEGGPRPWARHLSEALGFVAAAGALWLLYLLSRQLPSDALALIELALLALALVAWLRATTRRRRLAAALGVVLAGLALLVVWLAERQRLAPRPEPPPATSAVSPSNHPVDPRLDAHDEPQNGA